MNDPKMSFTCRDGNQRIGLLRGSGGYVVFTLLAVNETPSQEFSYNTVDIDTPEKFDKLWNFLKELK